MILNREMQVAAIAGGVLLFLGHFVALVSPNGGAGALSKTLTFVAHLLLALGVLGAYGAVSQSAGLAGRIGTLLAFVGTIVVTAVVFVEIAGTSGVNVEQVTGARSVSLIATVGPMLFVIGVVLFGIAVAVAVPGARAAGILLVVGTVVFASGTMVPSVEAAAATLGGGLTGAGFVILGLRGLLM